MTRIVPFPVRVQPRRQHFLMLQGPFGPFFRHLAKALRKAGHRVTKVHLNGADMADWGGLPGSVLFRDPRGRWSAWLRRLMIERHLTDLIVYGDCQDYHREAISVARSCGLRIHVFEQGYFRPHWVTLERDGVNGFSPRLGRPFAGGIPAARQDEAAAGPLCARASRGVRRAHVAQTIIAALATYGLSPLFPTYRSPFAASGWSQAWGSLRRYVHLRRTRARRLRRIAAYIRRPEPYFLVLLQRPGDSQLTVHSPFPCLEQAMERIIGSFAAHAPVPVRLLFKCHPLDPGLDDHAATLRRMARAHGVAGRVGYADGGVLREMLDWSCGAVTVNSTAGLVALEAGRPTVVLGRALYDVSGLTFQDGLDRFWCEGRPPDPRRFKAFRRWLMAETQVMGNFWTRAGIALALPTIVARLTAPAAAQERAADRFEVAEPSLARAAAGEGGSDLGGFDNGGLGKARAGPVVRSA